MSSTIPLPPREQLHNRYCSNKHTRPKLPYSESPTTGPVTKRLLRDPVTKILFPIKHSTHTHTHIIMGALKENSRNMSIRVLHPLTAAARDEVEVLGYRVLPEGSRLNPTARDAPPLPGRACWVSRRGGTPTSAQRATVCVCLFNITAGPIIKLCAGGGQ